MCKIYMIYIVQLVLICVTSLCMVRIQAEILPDTIFLNVFDGLKKIFESEDACGDCLTHITPIVPICANDGSNYPNNKTLQCWKYCCVSSPDANFKEGIDVAHMGLCPRPHPS